MRCPRSLVIASLFSAAFAAAPASADDVSQALEAAMAKMAQEAEAFAARQDADTGAGDEEDGPVLDACFPDAIPGWRRDVVEDDGNFDPRRHAIAGYSRTDGGRGVLSVSVVRTRPDAFGGALPHVAPKLGPSDEVPTAVTTRERLHGVDAYLMYDSAMGENEGSGELNFAIGPYQFTVSGSGLPRRDLLALARAVDTRVLAGQ